MKDATKQAFGRATLNFTLISAAHGVTRWLGADDGLATVVSAGVPSAVETMFPVIDDIRRKHLTPQRVLTGRAPHLHEQLAKAADADQLKAILSSFSREFDTSSRIEAAIKAADVVNGSDGRTIERLLDWMVELFIDNFGVNEPWVNAIAAVLTRFHKRLTGNVRLLALHDFLEMTFAGTSVTSAPKIECLAYIAATQGRHGLELLNARRYVKDVAWLKADYTDGLDYYRTEKAMLRAAVRHLDSRDIPLHGHDLARICHLYPLYRHDDELAADVINMKHTLLGSLKVTFSAEFALEVEGILERKKLPL